MLIERAVSATPELLDALRRLIPQLTSSNHTLEVQDLEGLLKSDSSVLLIARLPDLQARLSAQVRWLSTVCPREAVR